MFIDYRSMCQHTVTWSNMPWAQWPDRQLASHQASQLSSCFCLLVGPSVRLPSSWPHRRPAPVLSPRANSCLLPGVFVQFPLLSSTHRPASPNLHVCSSSSAALAFVTIISEIDVAIISIINFFRVFHTCAWCGATVLLLLFASSLHAVQSRLLIQLPACLSSCQPVSEPVSHTAKWSNVLDLFTHCERFKLDVSWFILFSFPVVVLFMYKSLYSCLIIYIEFQWCLLLFFNGSHWL